MFKLVGTPKRVAFAKLIFEGHQDFDTEEVREMEASFADTGGEPLHYPLVTKVQGKTTFKVVAGRTRLKALKRSGQKEVLVQFVAGDEKDLTKVSIIENLYRRREDPKELLKALDDARRAIIPQLGEQLRDARRAIIPQLGEQKQEAKAKRGRPSEGKGEARKVVAKLTGQTAKAIEHQEYRARAVEETENEPGEAPPADKPKPPIDLHGLDVPADVLKAAEKEQALLGKMSHLLTELKGTYTEYQTLRGEREGLDSGQHYTDALRDAFKAFAAVRKQRPVSVCMNCKLWPAVRKTCGTCSGTGYMDKEHLNAMEATGSNPLMMEGDDAGVWLPTRDGPQWRTLLSLRGEDF